MTQPVKLDRRQCLVGTGALTVTFALKPTLLAASVVTTPMSKKVIDTEVDAYLAIDTRGVVTLYSGKVDLGTGVETAMMQIVAEELDVHLDNVRVIQGDTALTPDQMPTIGSNSIQKGGMQIRRAAATARHALMTRAAKRLTQDVDNLIVEAGVVKTKDGPSADITYGDLIGNELFDLDLDPQVPFKDPSKFLLVGTSVPRVDIPDKCTGTFTYMQDFVVPGMLHGRVVRPPALGAKLQSVDEVSVANIVGLIKVVRIADFLGVVATSEWAAIKAANQLQATWSSWQGLPDQAEIWEHVRATKIIHEDVTSKIGKGADGLVDGATRMKASYDFAINTHGSIGPSCAIAEMKNGALMCWTASQATHNLVKQLALMLDLSPANVRCIYVEGSGCYGRNGHEDAAGDAALLARAVGQPVRLQWSRHDEHGWDPKGPPTLVDLDAALDENGEVQTWSSQFFIPQGAATVVPLVPAVLGVLPYKDILSPGGITGNTAIQYSIPNVQTVAHRLESTPLRPSWIRTPGRMQNTFANESFMDELTLAAGRDPFEYRRERLNDPRALALLDKLHTVSDWQTPDQNRERSGDLLKGRGMAYVKYELVRTYVGGVADVEIDRNTGSVRCTKFIVVQDCGQIINPDGVRNQLQGNVIQTVSRCLLEEVTFDRAMVTSLDWATYPIITFPDIPEIVTELMDRPNEPPWGAGEPSAAIVPPALCNAIADALGVRLRSIPFKREKVLAALKHA